jgi:hypothetical protein
VATGTITAQQAVRLDVEKQIADMERAGGITPWSKAEEGLEDLVAALLERFRHDDMRPSEVRYFEEVAEQATEAAMRAVREAIVDRLLTV